MKLKAMLIGSTLLLFLAATCDAMAQQKRLYRWVDEDGNVFYSDQIPPDEVDRARDEFSERGTRAGQVERAPTAEERAAAAAAAAAEADAARAEADEARARRNLLIAFPHEEDLLRTQRQRVDVIDSTINAFRASLSAQERSLAGMLSHAADAERSGQRVPERIATSIASLRQQVESQMAQIAAKEAEKEELLRVQEIELQQYREIKAETAKARR
ncbi:MAG TPA: DUF4124 domain-containing protein [Xanthomonadaceae bacterium]|nr:DUF4124 domain-containing protein [Xanthomonadaceae bacterium]